MHTAFFGLPNNSQVIRVWGAAAPRVFLTRITCFLSVCFLSWEAFFSFFNAASEFVVFLMCPQNNDEHE